MHSVAVKLKHERELRIGEESKTPNTHPFYEYKNSRHDLPLIEIDHEYLIYRIANIRTIIDQFDYIRQAGLAVGFFSDGEENVSAQQAQHEILLKIARKGKSTSVVPIYSELENSEQKDPLIITASGVVVNGNRRLSAMRDLLSSDSKKYERFRFVRCAVLPATISEKEIEDIEFRLQMTPETRLPYLWINEGFGIRKKLNRGETYGDISTLMRSRKHDVEVSHNMVVEAEQYLEWAQRPAEYHLVQDGEQMFKELSVALLRSKNEDEKDIRRRMAWGIFSTSANNLDGRKHDYRIAFGKDFDRVFEKMMPTIDEVVPSIESDDPDDIDISLDKRPNEFLKFIRAFDDLKTRPIVTKELISVCESVKQQVKEEELGMNSLKAATDAHKKLYEVDLTTADPGTYEELGKQLETIEKQARRLLHSLRDIQK